MGLQELLFLRFANTILEPVWNRNYLAYVQITMFESFGVEDRGHFYDPVGALRDVVVNHLMQVVGMAAMEAPAGGDPDTLKDAMLAVFRATNTADPAHYVRGQYEATSNRRRRAGLDHGDVRRAAPGDRQRALVGRAVLHPHRQADADHPDRAPPRLPPPAAARPRC
jgi:glucose-6-phosphate 1-dehydrogenase